ncbi:hypothetical protein SGLAM104S_10677 [Streptomyces glaucescens]
MAARQRHACGGPAAARPRRQPAPPAATTGPTPIAAAQGFIVQQSLFGPVPVEVLRNGLRALMSMGRTSDES